MSDAAVLAQKRQDDLQKKFIDLIFATQPALICDIGSLNGIDAIAFRQAAPSATIIAFEASPKNFEDARSHMNFAQHNISWNYMAVGDRDGVATFNAMVVDTPADVYDWRRGASSLLPHRGERTSPVSVPICKLDTFLGDRGLLDKEKALWIDVEGAESIVLAGAEKALESTLFLKVEVESYEHWTGQKLARETLAPLLDRGFTKIFSSETEGITQYDVLLVSKQLSARGFK